MSLFSTLRERELLELLLSKFEYVIHKVNLLMTQNELLVAAMADLTAAAGKAEAAIAAELAQIAVMVGDNPVVATAITNIQAVTAALNLAAASVPAPVVEPVVTPAA